MIHGCFRCVIGLEVKLNMDYSDDILYQLQNEPDFSKCFGIDNDVVLQHEFFCHLLGIGRKN